MVKGSQIVCSYQGCKRKFRFKKELNAHIVEIHSPYNIFECEICNKPLNSRHSYKEHMNLHTGNRPYSCVYPGCKKKFKYASQLSNHKKIHPSEESDPLPPPVPSNETAKTTVRPPFLNLPPLDFGKKNKFSLSWINFSFKL